MLNEKIKREIIYSLDEYLKLNNQQNYKKAGLLYRKLTEHLFGRLAHDSMLFQSVVDDLLYFTENPHVQIEIATEAIGLEYRKNEAIQLLEEYAVWKPGMTLQSKEGEICNLAQMRLHNLLGYTLNYDNDYTWKRSLEQKITPQYQHFFEKRSKNIIEIKSKSVGYMNEEGEINFIDEINQILPDNQGGFLFACLTTEKQYIFLSVSEEGQLLRVYENISNMGAFRKETAIFYTTNLSGKDGQYGVIKANGEICIPPIFQEIWRLNDYFFIGISTESNGNLYNQWGQLIQTNINMHKIITNNSPTFIYENILYNELGKMITNLSLIGSNWEGVSILNVDEYEGFDSGGNVIRIDSLGNRLSFTCETNEKFKLDKKGEVYISRSESEVILHMDEKNYELFGDVDLILSRFADQYFLLKGQWKKGSYLWVDRKKKIFTFFKDVKCTDSGYWFGIEVLENGEASDFWVVFNEQGKKIITEKKHIINIFENTELGIWHFEVTYEFKEAFFLPRKKKIITKEQIVKRFIKNNQK